MHNNKSAAELVSASFHCDLNVLVLSYVITVSLFGPIFECLPRWGTEDAEIKVRASAENPELSERSFFKAWSRSTYSFASIINLQ